MADDIRVSFWNKYLLPVIVGGTSGILTGLITVTIAIMSFKNTVLNELNSISIKLEERTQRIAKLEIVIDNKADKATVLFLSEMTAGNNASIIAVNKDIEYLRKNSETMLGKLDHIRDNIK